MKKVKDERLILQNLKNIRIAYIVQTVGIVVFLGYDLVTKGVDLLFENPFMLIIISAVIGMLVTFSEDSNLLNGVTMGGILFVCGLVPVMYIYYLRKKQTTDNDN